MTTHEINHVKIALDIRRVILTARILIRLVFTLRFAVTEQLFVDTLAITAR